MAKYTLVGQDGEVFSLMRYTARSLRKEGLEHLVKEMFDKLRWCDYFSTIMVCEEYIDKANDVAENKLD